MRSRKPLWAAIAVVVIVATVLSIVTVSVPDDETLPQFTIPVGKVGDKVVYQIQNDGYAPHAKQTSWVKQSDGHFNHDFEQIPAIEVVSVSHYDHGASFGMTQQIGLSDRLVFKTTEMSESSNFWTNSSAYLPMTPRLPAVEMQGQDLYFGKTFLLSKEGGGVGALGVTGGAGFGGVGPFEWTTHGRTVNRASMNESAFDPPRHVEGRVTEAGSINGETVLGVRTGLTETVNYSSNPHTRMSPIKEIETTNVYWFSKQVPYPVLIESNQTRHHADGTTSFIEEKRALAEYVPGDSAIEWGQEVGRPMKYPMSAPEGLHPDEGSGGGLSYPLNEAIEDVEQGLDLEWLAWRTAEPEAPLVSATMTRGATTWLGEETMEWRLVFMGSEDAYEVRTERHPETNGPIVEGMGETGVPIKSYRPAESMLTISGVVDLWRTVRSDPDAQPNFLHWGIVSDSWRTSRSCLGGVGFSTEEVDQPERMLRQVQIGEATYGPCRDEDTSIHYDALVIDVQLPRLLFEIETVTDYDARPSPDSRPSGTEVQSVSSLPADSGFFTMGPPYVERGTAIAVPLLAVVFTVYFFPLLQFAATKGMLFLPAFSRIKKSDVLDHELRERLHTMIRENPGITPSQLKNATGAGWGTIVHHLMVMEREDLVASKIQGRFRRFFIADEIPPAERASLALLANKRTQEIYTNLIDAPGLATGELADRVGVTPAGALKHLNQLEEIGLLERRRDGRYVRYYPVQGFRPYDPREAVEVA